MVETRKRYVINIDFPTAKGEKGHKIHLNPYYESSVLREKVLKHYDPEKDKIPKDGGAVYLNRVEALECLKGDRQIEWLGKSASIFRPCKLCSKLLEWDLGK